MAELRERFFPHRRNPNGTFDSICLTCFKTVATTEKEADLRKFDQAHLCDSVLMAEREMFYTRRPD